MNYRETSDSSDEAEETFDSVTSNLSLPTTPLSPSNQHFLLQTSPPPTRQLLNDAANNLKLVEAVQNIVPNWPSLEGESTEEVPEQNAVMPDNENAAAAAVDFEDENAADDAKALEYTRTLKMEFSKDDIDFWFTQIENEMYTCGVKSQWMKRCVLVKNLPPHIQSDVKSLLTLKQSAAPTNLYKQIKMEILRIHAPKEDENFKKALSRVLTGLPSQLGQVLINDICDKPVKLDGCCCHKAVRALWTLQLPIQVRGHVADMEFNKATYQAVFQAADKVFISTKTTELSAGVAAIATPSTSDTQVAAVRSTNQRQNRGGGRNRGNGRGGSGSGRGGAQNRQPKPSVPEGCCDNHKKWAGDAWFCLEPLTCPLVSKCSAKPTDSKNKNK